MLSELSKTSYNFVTCIFQVQYAALNVTDIQKASGIISFENNKKHFGMEFSGLTER